MSTFVHLLFNSLKQFCCGMRKVCASPHNLWDWKLYAICCQSVAWYEWNQTNYHHFPFICKSKCAQSANSIYRFCKFRLDAPEELFEQLQSHDNTAQKLLLFEFIVSTSNGTQVQIILPTIMSSMRVKNLNWQKPGGKEEMKPCWWKYPKGYVYFKYAVWVKRSTE